jgi:hypothetical protein
MSVIPIRVRVKVAYGFYQVGHIFLSPPMPATMRDELIRQGYLEMVTDISPESKEKKQPKKARR